MRRLKKGITIWRRNTPAHLRTHSPPGAFYFQSKSQVLSHLLLAAVCGLRPLGSTAERSAVVTEVTGWVHLVLNESTHRRRPSNANPCRHEFAHGEGLKSWATWNLKFTLHYTGFTAACQLSLPPEFQTCLCWLYSRFSSVWRQDSCSSQLDTEKGWVNAEHLRGQIEPTSCMCAVKYSLMMAMRELKFPMLKHSWATSMKNSMIRALCFFFIGLNERTNRAGQYKFNICTKLCTFGV